jgi:hypothetical protein
MVAGAAMRAHASEYGVPRVPAGTGLLTLALLPAVSMLDSLVARARPATSASGGRARAAAGAPGGDWRNGLPTLITVRPDNPQARR